jgi:hypothetical protein
MSDDVRFRLGGKVYTTASLDEISLRDLMVFERETAAMGLPMKWSDVERIGSEMAELPADGQHPDTLLMVGVTIWAARRAAGDDVTFEQAIDFPMKDLEFIDAPKDHQAPTNPTRARKGKGSAKKKSGGSPRPVSVPDLDLSDSSSSTADAPTSTTSAQQSATA